MNIYFKSLIGERETNEDYHIIFKHKNIDIYGICDGHGGDKVAKLLSAIIPKIFTTDIINFPLEKNQIVKIWKNIQRKICKQYYGIESGSTCILVIIYTLNDNQKVLYSINVGDSRALLCSFDDKNINFKHKILPLSIDHKPINIDERKRIESMGGKIKIDNGTFRIGDLSLSRAFGDCDNIYTNPVPDIKFKKISVNDKFIVLACDGLFDVVDNETVTNIIISICYNDKNIRKNKHLNIADFLANYAIENGSTDNVSVIVLFLD